ncbi:MAG: hypothetical protein LBL31_05575 [Spirochaetaceae bacterium]|jgi:hypothetical protein|nr:hypothetical protein [Spirochaetaceae bacterium]
MNGATALRKELRGYIDSMPERHLSALKPLLADLAESGADYWTPVIEPASPEEAAMIEERMKDYYADPSSFIPLENIK